MAVKKVHDAAVKAEGRGEDDNETKQQTMSSLEDSLPVFLETIWDMAVVDIESTVRVVCKKLTKDVSVPWQIRVRRAHALARIGRVFLDYSQVECEEETMD